MIHPMNYVVQFLQDIYNMYDLIHKADEALYEVKSNGRNKALPFFYRTVFLC